MHISASQSGTGTVLVTVANLDDTQSAMLDCILSGLGKIENVTGRIMAGGREAHNTFTEPEAVKPQAVQNIQLTADGFTAVLPACCVAAFEVKAE